MTAMPRFFAEPENINGNIITLYSDDAVHISRVLRGKAGDILTVCDGKGNDYTAEITSVSDKSVTLEIKETFVTKSEPSVRITLYQGLPKGDKMETIIQKCVELGVCGIVPVNTERCIVKIDKNKENKKMERWRKIAESAAKQSGRGIIPSMGQVVSFENALKEASSMDGAVIPYELEEKNGLKSFLDGFKGESLAVFIGPEGGFSIDEIEKAVKSGVVPVTLGKRILRTETAGMAAVANILFYIDM